MFKLEESDIDALFDSCLFTDKEIVDGRPTDYFTVGQSVNPEKKYISVVFSTKKLEKNKESIISYLDLLPNLEKGNTLENLFYDFNGNKWCKDIRFLDELLMMAVACNLVSYTAIDDKKEEIVIFKRTRENDNLKVKGEHPTCFQPAQDSLVPKAYTAEEKIIIACNKIRIAIELEQYVNIINVGLGFFGIHVCLSDTMENQINFYNSDNELLFSKVFEDTDGIVGIEGILNQRLRSEFQDLSGNTITYFFDGDKHIFILSPPEEEMFHYRIEITFDKNMDKYTNIAVSATNAKADYVIKKFEINDYDLIAELNNQFGSYGNYEDGVKRFLWYRDNRRIRDRTLFMSEDEWYEKGHLLCGDEGGIKVDGNSLISGLNYKEFHVIATQVARHPRNRELILYTLDEIDKQLPGLKDFIVNHFSLYHYIMATEYQVHPLTDWLVQSAIHEKCDLSKKRNVKLKKEPKN